MVVGEFTQEVDLVVIGGGPGGYSAAFRAAELGIETVIIDEHDRLGGICLHAGCIPSKTLLHIAETINLGEHAKHFGVEFGTPKIDLDTVRAWVDHARGTLAKGLTGLANKHSVELIKGNASFEDSRRLNVRDSQVPRIRFRRAIIATGSVPGPHPHLPFDREVVLSPNDAIELPRVPKRLLIVGSGYMALELATIYHAFGSSVTIVDEGEQWLPDVDADLVRPLLRTLTKRLAGLHTKTAITAADQQRGTLKITFDGESPPKGTTYDAAIIAIGQQPNVDRLNLSATSVGQDDNGFINVNEHMRTVDPRVFAVGDVTGGELLADRALMQGRIAAEVIAGWNSGMDVTAPPSAIFTDPQISWCGLTETSAKAEGIPHAVAKMPWGASGRAVGMGRTDGITKVIYDPDAKLILGVGVTGRNAAELISEGALAIEMGAVATDIAGTIHPHPTLSELLAEAALHIENREQGSGTEPDRAE